MNGWKVSCLTNLVCVCVCVCLCLKAVANKSSEELSLMVELALVRLNKFFFVGIVERWEESIGLLLDKTSTPPLPDIDFLAGRVQTRSKEHVKASEAYIQYRDPLDERVYEAGLRIFEEDIQQRRDYDSLP